MATKHKAVAKRGKSLAKDEQRSMPVQILTVCFTVLSIVFLMMAINKY